jgi:cellulose synthase/poly-beta-1,6-N-acetylglucosamine synthase-like glycosyltransferase
MAKKGKTKTKAKANAKAQSKTGVSSRKDGVFPFVSVCTPTFNRRPFILEMVKNYLRQDYPHDKMEWIIIDDGTDKIGDLVQDVPDSQPFKLM